MLIYVIILGMFIKYVSYLFIESFGVKIFVSLTGMFHIKAVTYCIIGLLLTLSSLFLKLTLTYIVDRINPFFQPSMSLSE